MKSVATVHQLQACLEAWANCKLLLQNHTGNELEMSQSLIRLVKDCALMCIGSYHALHNDSINLSSLAVLCVGLCLECAEACDRYPYSLFQQCAASCRSCSTAMSELALEAI